jgi:hypothetical protein
VPLFNEMFAFRAAVRRHGRAYLLGLLSHPEERVDAGGVAGEVSPDGMQRLLTRRGIRTPAGAVAAW